MSEKIISALPIILNLIFYAIAVIYLNSTFSRERNSIVKRLLFLLGGGVVLGMGLMLFDKGIAKVLLFMVSSVIFSFTYKQKLSVRFLLTAIIISLVSVADVISLITITLLFSVTPEVTLVPPFNVLGIVFMFFIVQVILFVIRHTREFVVAKRFDKRWLFLYILPISSTFVIFMEYAVFCNYDTSDDINVIMLIGAILLLITNYVVFVLSDAIILHIEDEKRLETAKMIISQQEKRYSDLYEKRRELRKLRHNHKNFLLGVLSELEKENYINVKNAFENELGVLNNEASSQALSGNSVFDSILSYKIAQASSHGIRFDLEFHKLSTIGFSDIDLAVLLGNALDNAIEATVKVEKDDRVIELVARINDSQLIITIVNPVAQIVDTNTLATDKNDSFDHGFGILTMMQIAEKYDGDVIFNYNDNKFITIIYLSLLGAVDNE